LPVFIVLLFGLVVVGSVGWFGLFNCLFIDLAVLWCWFDLLVVRFGFVVCLLFVLLVVCW